MKAAAMNQTRDLINRCKYKRRNLLLVLDRAKERDRRTPPLLVIVVVGRQSRLRRSTDGSSDKAAEVNP